MEVVGEHDGSTRQYEMRARQEAVDRNREAILRAMVSFWLQRHYDEITLSDVADLAGVTRQTIYRQFGTKDDLLVAAAEWFEPELDADLHAEPGDVEDAVRRLVGMYERMGDANVRTLELEGRVEAMDHLLKRGRRSHRAWIEQVFAPLLPESGKSRRDATLALYAATDVMVWKLLRRDFGCSRSRTEATIRRLIEGVLVGLPNTNAKA